MLILGSTGSVGEQAIDVARQHTIPVRGLAASYNWRRVEAEAREFSVPVVAMADETAAKELRVALADTRTRVLAGQAGIEQMIRESDARVAVNAILGEAGLLPTLSVLDAGLDPTARPF